MACLSVLIRVDRSNRDNLSPINLEPRHTGNTFHLPFGLRYEYKGYKGYKGSTDPVYPSFIGDSTIQSCGCISFQLYTTWERRALLQNTGDLCQRHPLCLPHRTATPRIENRRQGARGRLDDSYREKSIQSVLG